MARPRSKGNARGGTQNIPVGIAHIRSTFNNTRPSVISRECNLVASAGHMDSRFLKGTPRRGMARNKSPHCYGTRHAEVSVREGQVQAVKRQFAPCRPLEWK